MKKFISVVSILSIMLVSSIYYLNNISKINVEISFEVINVNVLEVYYVKDGNLERLSLNKLTDNEILDVFDYLTINKNHALKEYISYVPSNCRVIDYEIENNILILNLNKLIYLTFSEKEEIMLNQIIQTYKLLGFTNVDIYVEGFKLERINDYIVNK